MPYMTTLMLAIAPSYHQFNLARVRKRLDLTLRLAACRTVGNGYCTVIAAGILFRVSDFKDASCLGRARVSAQAYAHDERNKLLAWADVMTAAGDFSRETGLRCEVKLVLGMFASVQHPDGNIAGRMRDA
jgi:hypothetical protein